MHTVDYRDARLHTIPGAPRIRDVKYDIQVQHRINVDKLNAEEALRRFGPDPEPNDDPELKGHSFYHGQALSILEYEDYWKQCGLTFSWIDPKPMWVSSHEWCYDILPDPELEYPTKPPKRVFRLSLKGGGQVRVTEKWYWSDFLSGDKHHLFSEDPELFVTADVGNGLHHYIGMIEGVVGEMSNHAALFRKGTPQAATDRVADTLRLIEGDDQNFYALLVRGKRCGICNKPLKDEVSQIMGVGPSCAKGMRIPHTLMTANAILKRRKELLGDVPLEDPLD